MNENNYAFPVGTYDAEKFRGMTLRDYFAAKAMQSLVANEMHSIDTQFAKQAYRVADAMLKARES